MNPRRLASLVRKECMELVRDRVFFAMGFVIAPMMMLLFGYGMIQDVENVPFGVLDYDHSRMSRELADRVIASRYFAFKGYVESARDADRRITSGNVRFVLTIPEHFQRRVQSGLPTGVQTLLDGTFIVTIRTTRAYVDGVVGAAAADLQAEYYAAHAGVPMDRVATGMQPIRVESRYLYNQPLVTVWGVAPLLIMLILTWSTPMLMSVSVVRERETGAIYNVYASTATRAEYLLGKMLPVVAVCFLNALVLWLMAVFYYGTPFRGSFGCFLVATAFFSFAACGLGLVISVAVRTQFAALMVSIMSGSMVASQFSGINVPVQDLTGASYYLAHLFPAMYYTDVVQAVFLKSGGWPEVWQDVAALAVYAVAVVLFGIRLFHKRSTA